ncbi:MAG TPA: glycosyltransferase [Terriglobales bacterium]|nr:glycosyltransferase [Terriglobales bacterium]
MDNPPIFYDPARKRWKIALRVLAVSALVVIALLAAFIVEVARNESLPRLILPPEAAAHPVAARYLRYIRHREEHRPRRPPRHRREHRVLPARPLPQGVRAAFYVNWDAPAYSALRAHIRDIDVLFCDWLHAAWPDGHIESSFDAQADYGIKDSNIFLWARADNPDLAIVPMVNNYDGTLWQGEAAGRMFADPAARAAFRQQLLPALRQWNAHGVVIDFENIPTSAQSAYHAFLAELHPFLQQAGVKMYLSLPVADNDYDLAAYARQTDVVILMDYDEHWQESAPGPIASQDWFLANLQAALKAVPRDKLMVGLPNYGYDWPQGRNGSETSVQGALVAADESGSDVHLDPQSLNPTLDYDDDAGRLHHVWFTDAVTAVNEMRGAAALGINNFALWRLGSGDGSLWPVFDKFMDNALVEKALAAPAPGYEIDREGKGDIFRVASEPETGIRRITIDPASNLITGEHYLRYPSAYRLDMYGYAPKAIALTFDDGPDPRWTPRILDILRANGVHGTFFVIGANVDRFPNLVRRAYAEGNEIGNHTFLHPDSSDISRLQLQLELNSTERLVESILGVKMVLFRPPYGVDATPTTNDEVRPLEDAQQLGYIVVGEGIDPHDWQRGTTSDAIVASVLAQLGQGSILLLHDAGGDRAATVAALPRIIAALRQRGYRFVLVSDLMGRTRAQVMPPLGAWDRIGVWLAGAVFTGLRWLETAIIWIFILGIVLMTARVVVIGLLAGWQKFRPHRPPDPRYAPPLAVVIPAFNEEAVIAATVRSVLRSDYPAFRVLVVDDGSRDATLAVLRAEFGGDARVLILTKPNGGKASALNYGIARVTEPIFVTIDADTAVAPDALRLLAAHFSDPAVGAVAGNAKVGNRVNMVTWFQAGEYITSQNLERRGLDALNCITVVPGAIGCWRTDIVRRLGGFPPDTTAEDADLTLSIRRLGCRIVYEDHACAYTEAPMTIRALMKQRLRWSYGILQTVWKHRAAFWREGTLGHFALPNVVLFQVILPLFGPITDLMVLFALAMEWFNYTSHPQSWTPDSLERLLFFFAVLMFVDLLGSVVAFALEHQEQWTLVGSVFLQRIVYRHVMAVVMFQTLRKALEGGEFHWGKLERTGTLEERFKHAQMADRS